MTRVEKELKILSEIFTSETFIGSFENDWGYLYLKVKNNGWSILSDLEIDLIYTWWFKIKKIS